MVLSPVSASRVELGSSRVERLARTRDDCVCVLSLRRDAAIDSIPNSVLRLSRQSSVLFRRLRSCIAAAASCSCGSAIFGQSYSAANVLRKCMSRTTMLDPDGLPKEPAANRNNAQDRKVPRVKLRWPSADTSECRRIYSLQVYARYLYHRPAVLHDQLDFELAKVPLSLP
ncbi:hypothetical protein LIA77_05982 [Sarocladium implicatum]|nr:hypothetical protein LIA77_05982 [Sarocladium implicatum]